ncbi:MAG: hypothetical protein M3Q97_04150, partial [Bacteroidota bacterium]|nr:hypothetical protein [Bacteroidota bacterium]
KQHSLKIVAVFFLVSFCGLFISCSKEFSGQEDENLSPETYTITDTIIRSGASRLTSQITAHWWGTDPDGFVDGFEISKDRVDWIFTESQDSTFTVDIPAGKDSFDFVLWVRSLDNTGQRDKSPASLSYPVRNSPPEIAFTYSKSSGSNPSRNPQVTFPVTRWNWTFSDPDGEANLSYIELIWNDTVSTPTRLPQLYSGVVLEAIDWTAAITSARIYPGSQDLPITEIVNGLLPGDTNRLYIRVSDDVGAKSKWVASYPVYIKKPTSKILLVNANSTQIQERESFYMTHLQSVGITNFEITRVNEIINNNYTELAPDNFTQSLIFGHFDHMVWFGSSAEYTLSLGQRTTDLFFGKGGTLFLATNFSSAVDEQAGFLEFTPIDSLVDPPVGSQFRLNNNAAITPAFSNWPVLKSQKIIGSARPFYERQNSNVLYNAEITKSSGVGAEIWQSKSTVMARRINAQGNTDFIISSLELENLNGNGNMKDLFQKIFIEELQF